MLSLLLVTLAAAFAPSFQDPAPAGEPETHWNGECEDAYRRALHLWQVRGKPGEAAEILQGMADDAEVIQRPGQSAWVLALAARAWHEAGRGEETTALLPGIERGARGTPFEPFVRRELQALESAGAGELDQAFLESLVELLSQEYTGENASASRLSRMQQVQRYQRVVLPYLLEIVDLWGAGKVSLAVAQEGISIGFTMANAPFVDALTERLDELSTLSFLSVVPSATHWTLDDEAEWELTRFYERYARHADPERARAAKSSLGSQLPHSRTSAVRDAVLRLLADEDERQDELLLAGCWGSDRVPISFLRTVAQGGNPSRATLARQILVSREDGLDELLSLAQTGDPYDRARYLLGLCRYSSGYIHKVDGRSVWWMDALRASGLAASFPADRNPLHSRDLPPGGQPHPRFEGFEFMRGAPLDGEMRTLLAVAALLCRDETGVDLAYEGGLPSDEYLVFHYARESAQKSGSVPKVIGNRLFQLPGAFDLQWNLALQYAPHALNLKILDLAPAGRWEEVSRNLLANLLQVGRVDEAVRVFLDVRLNDRQCRDLLPYLLRPSVGWLHHLEPITARVLALSREERTLGLVAIRDQMWQAAPMARAALGADQWLRIMEQLYAADVECMLAPWLVQDWEQFGRDVTARFTQDEKRFGWWAHAVFAHLEWPTSSSVLRELIQRGAPADWLQEGGVGFEHLMMGEDEALTDLALALLRRKDVDSQRLGLQCLRRRPQDADRCWDLVAPLWKSPALAGLLADTMRMAKDRDRLVAGMLEAAALPKLEDRSLLIQAVAAVPDARLAPILLAALADADVATADAARAGLQRLKEIEEQRNFWEAWRATGVGENPTAALLRQAQHENKEIRLSAIRALGAIQAKEALPLLIQLLEDRDQEVVAAARAALKWIAD